VLNKLRSVFKNKDILEEDIPDPRACGMNALYLV
jgi:hypothetical protein